MRDENLLLCAVKITFSILSIYCKINEREEKNGIVGIYKHSLSVVGSNLATVFNQKLK